MKEHRALLRAHGQGSSCAFCNALQHTATHCNALQHTATHCVLQSAVVCCSVLQCVAVCCSVLQCVGQQDNATCTLIQTPTGYTLQHTMQHNATHCNTLQLIQTPRGYQIGIQPFCHRVSTLIRRSRPMIFAETLFLFSNKKCHKTYIIIYLIHTLSLCHTHTLSLSLCHTHSLSLSLSHALSLSLSHTHTLIRRSCLMIFAETPYFFFNKKEIQNILTLSFHTLSLSHTHTPSYDASAW